MYTVFRTVLVKESLKIIIKIHVAGQITVTVRADTVAAWSKK